MRFYKINSLFILVPLMVFLWFFASFYFGTLEKLGFPNVANDQTRTILPAFLIVERDSGSELKLAGVRIKIDDLEYSYDNGGRWSAKMRFVGEPNGSVLEKTMIEGDKIKFSQYHIQIFEIGDEFVKILVSR